MRGKVKRICQIFLGLRITPAYAGKSIQSKDLFTNNLDHPRLCGEKLCKRCSSASTKGSPPPMRGKVTSPLILLYRDRITPAYAGKSQRRTQPFWKRQDHPRLCGEKLPPYFHNLVMIGSPPPMRGKVINFSVFVIKLRITPAYAGKSDQNLSDKIIFRDHPRLCGEKLSLI